MKRRFSEEQIAQILREGAAAETTAEVWRKYGISEWTYYRWRQRYGGLAESQAKRLKHLAQENARLGRLVAQGNRILFWTVVALKRTIGLQTANARALPPHQRPCQHHSAHWRPSLEGASVSTTTTWAPGRQERASTPG